MPPHRCVEASRSLLSLVEAHDRNYIGDILRRLERQFKIERFSVDTASPNLVLAPVGRIG
jgi:hypothetical protein